MASLVGKRNFDDFLKEYVVEYGGKLVNSEVHVIRLNLCFYSDEGRGDAISEPVPFTGFVLSPLSIKNMWEIMVIRIKKPNCVLSF